MELLILHGDLTLSLQEVAAVVVGGWGLCHDPRGSSVVVSVEEGQGVG